MLPDGRRTEPDAHRTDPDAHRTEPDGQFSGKVANNHPPEAKNRPPEAKKREKDEDKRQIVETTPSFGHPSDGGDNEKQAKEEEQGLRATEQQEKVVRADAAEISYQRSLYRFI